MRVLLLSLCFLFVLTAHSQELELKKMTSNLFKEVYSINKISKFKSGSYLKTDKKSKDTLISGTYLDDLKSGVWRYFSKDNKPWMSYDFSNKAFVILPEEISNIDSFVVRKSNSFSYTKVDLPPVYLGSKNEIERILNANFNIPKEIIETGKFGISMATFVVDRFGKMTEFHREQMLSDEVFKEMEENLKLIDGDWSPAIVAGKPVDSQIVMIYDITQQGAKSLFRDNPKAIVIHAQYTTVQNTKKSIGFGVGSE